jgi:hypothetical protein
LPNISSFDERAFLVLNKNGDFAILKGRWNGFVRRQTGDKKHKVINWHYEEVNNCSQCCAGF